MTPVAQIKWEGPTMPADGTYGHSSFALNYDATMYLYGVLYWLNGVSPGQYGTVTLARDDADPNACWQLATITGAMTQDRANFVGQPVQFPTGKPIAPEFARWGGGTYQPVITIQFSGTLQ